MIARRPGRRSLNRQAEFPAPTGGINAVLAANAIRAEQAIALLNMVPLQLGVSTRLGWQEWCTRVKAGAIAADTEVRSILSFKGALAIHDKLFAVTSDGIYDVSISADLPTRVVAFPSTLNLAGYGIATTVATAGGHFLLYCDEENGYYTYDGAAGTWLKVTAGGGAGQINGTDPANFAHVLEWKGRVWFTQKNSAKAWYLTTTYGIGTIYGTVASFDFGQHFKSGGQLAGLFRWTRDGGSGPDDRLVAVSTSGDVVVYEGTDPTSASTFRQVGSWVTGGVPSGREIATSLGGDVLLLTVAGLLPLSALLQGEALRPDVYATYDIQNLYATYVRPRAALPGWRMRLHPQENTLVVFLPHKAGATDTQFVYSLASKAWSVYEGVDARAAESWDGRLYFGDAASRVNVHLGGMDGIARDGTAATATPILFTHLTGFTAFGNAARKQVKIIRPHLILQGVPPDYGVQARYDYDLSAVTLPLSPPSPGGLATWDVALWDVGLWVGDAGALNVPIGTEGVGVAVAIALQGRAAERVTLAGYEIAWEEGGAL